MCFGNKLGFAFAPEFITNEDIFAQHWGAILLELPTDEPQPENALLVGVTQNIPQIQIADEEIALEELLNAWQRTLEPVYPTQAAADENAGQPQLYSYTKRAQIGAPAKAAQPRVLLPMFPGTNCEYDTARQFTKYGAQAETCIIANLTPALVEDSVQRLTAAIKQSQIIMLPGGFSGGDEPDGSGKFIATFFRNPRICEAVMEFLQQRGGLMLGICNGFQALVKLGLLPYGEIRRQPDPNL